MPHLGQEQDVAQGVGEEPAGHHERRPVRELEGADAQQRRVDHRRALARRAQREVAAQQQRHGERREHARVGPAPFRALQDREHQRGDRERQNEPAEQVRDAPAARRAALDEDPPGENERDDAGDDVDDEDQTPTRGGDQQTPDGRAQAGRERSDGGAQRDRVHALSPLMRLEHDRERGRHDHRRAGRLDDPRGDEQAERRRQRAQRRGGREEEQAERQDPAAAEEVRELPAADEEGGEHDVVGVQDPGDVREVGRGERLADVRDRDVDAAAVGERHRAAEHRDDEHGPGRGDPPRALQQRTVVWPRLGRHQPVTR